MTSQLRIHCLNTKDEEEEQRGTNKWEFHNKNKNLNYVLIHEKSENMKENSHRIIVLVLVYYAIMQIYWLRFILIPWQSAVIQSLHCPLGNTAA